MATWNEFTATEPTKAEDCRALLYQFEVGLAFLSTVRADGGPAPQHSIWRATT